MIFHGLCVFLQKLCVESIDIKVVKKILTNILKYLVPVIIGVGLFYFLYANVDVEEMKRVIKSDVNYWWFLPVIVVSTFSHIFRAMRWRLQLRAIGVDAPLSALINSIFGTYAVNLIFPRLGEVWRTGYIADRQKASFTTVLGSMVADRLTDTVTVLLLTVFTFFLAQDAFMQFLSTYPQIKDGIENMLKSPLLWIAAVGDGGRAGGSLHHEDAERTDTEGAHYGAQFVEWLLCHH